MLCFCVLLAPLEPTCARTGPSFSCTAASTQAELTICASDDLAEADFRLAIAYKYALSRNPGLKQGQRDWIRARNAKCGGNAQCFRSEIEARTALLRDTANPNVAATLPIRPNSAPDTASRMASGASEPEGARRAATNEPQDLDAELASVRSPSFECSDAHWSTALAICNDAKLAKLDGQMGVLLRHARTKYPQIDFDVTQQEFRENRSARCKASADCIESETFLRNGSLRALLAGDPEALAQELRTQSSVASAQRVASHEARERAAVDACLAGKQVADARAVALEVASGTHPRCQGIAGQNICGALLLACGMKSRGNADEDAACLLAQDPSLIGC